MKRMITCLIALAMLLAAAPAMAADKPTIYVAGDSTGQTYKQSDRFPQFGWGQVFGDIFTNDVVVINRAIGGRSAIRFDREGQLDNILNAMRPGDYFFIQFGINDSDTRYPEKYSPISEYKWELAERYIKETEKRGATPILMTPSAGGTYDEKKQQFANSRIEYADATRELADEIGCRFIDINRIMTNTYNTMDKDEVLSGYLICEPLESVENPQGVRDLSHFKEKGARLVTKMIADAIPIYVPELAKYLRGEERFTDIYGHMYEAEINRALADKLIRVGSDGKFSPDAEITRAEFLKLAMDAAQIPGHGYRKRECLEAPEDAWYRFYLQGALDKGLIPVDMTVGKMWVEQRLLAQATAESAAATENITSYRCGFKADTPITHEEMAVIAANCTSYAVNYSKHELAETYFFLEDINYEGMNPYYINAVESAYSRGLMEGLGKSFRPKANATKAQAITVANRIAQKLK
ncbi:MAG: S-layer homology domain-containing protein [Clostridia bacterium]|nr:S-layer homology domain-containing protein [Clostridia bacterium]